jgi:hypothetical protein
MMKDSFEQVFLALIVVAALAAPALAQTDNSLDSNHTAALSGKASETQPQTITGRITKLDTKSKSFSVRAGDNGEVVDLQARKDVDTEALRRGERVIVTYAHGVALKIQATRNEK